MERIVKDMHKEWQSKACAEDYPTKVLC